MLPTKTSRRRPGADRQAKSDRSPGCRYSADRGGTYRGSVSRKTPPDRSSGVWWWRRRDSWSISFETGWTMPSSCVQDAGRVIHGRTFRES